MFPCIKNLESFKKKGCPQKIWDGKEGCPCWIEMPVTNRGNPLKKEIRKQCIDLWMWEFQWAMLGLLEGNQQAVESFRNGMVEVGPDNKDRPKSDPGIIALIKLVEDAQNRQKTILEYEVKKQIPKE